MITVFASVVNAGELLIGLIAAGVTALGGWLAVSRRMSGKIRTTDATKLWDAAEQLRKEIGAQLTAANARVVEVEARMASVERSNNDLARENGDLKALVREYEATIDGLRTRLDELETVNGDLRRQLHERGQT